MLNMLPHGQHQHRCRAIAEEPENDREERILAILGIIGTVLNLLVVIFDGRMTVEVWRDGAPGAEEPVANAHIHSQPSAQLLDTDIS
ncbi:hypothetical protein DNTS_003577 [Danionella cerebrum]|uniref:Uncharacterized protein n=1 Tax=Danionella cerebrum TaxID=2873325 RepID=A0A553PZJ8_9TELE|nr:hypothetical protein DNTS_003577 [Danionella translucida]